MRKTSQKFLQSNLLCRVALVAILLAFQAMLGIGAGVLYAQKVTGTVISGSDNEPLIGASVMVQGTKVGSVTDLDGNFTIDAKNGQTLEVSYLGFITQKVKVNGQKPIVCHARSDSWCQHRFYLWSARCSYECYHPWFGYRRKLSASLFD